MHKQYLQLSSLVSESNDVCDLARTVPIENDVICTKCSIENTLNDMTLDRVRRLLWTL